MSGLSVSIAACLLIGIYLLHELSYDRHHTGADRIFRLVIERTGEGIEKASALTPELLAPALELQIPEIEHITRLEASGLPRAVRAGQRSFHEERFFFADSSFFSMFSHTFQQGDPAAALMQPGSVVLTASMASKYFPGENPIGRGLTYDGDDYQVTGIIEDVPSASHFHFDFLARLDPQDDEWFMYSAYTYVSLRSNTLAEEVEAKLEAFVESTINPQLRKGNFGRLRLQPLTDIHLQSNMRSEIEPGSDIRYVFIFSAIAVLLLLVASINYVTITTSTASERSMEVGMRKTFGAQQSTLIRQFIGESLLITLAALLFGLVIAALGLPMLNNVAGLQLTVSGSGLVGLVTFCVVVLLIVGVLAGSYPAFYLSRLSPVHALRDTLNTGRNRYIVRKILVSAQFTVSIALIVVTLVIQSQLDFLRTKHLGFDKEHIVVIHDWDGELRSAYSSFKNELTANPQILRVAAGSSPSRSGGYFVPLDSDRTDNESLLRLVTGEFDYPEALGLSFVSGESFSTDRMTDSTTAFIANELAMRRLRREDPAVASFSFWAGRGPIIGVVEDFHMRSLHDPVEPMLIMLDPGYSRTILVRVAPGQVRAAIAAMEQTWSTFAPGKPLAFTFLDEEINAAYQAEQRLAGIFRIFAGLIVLVSCLGLFGLVALTVEQRTKEIGIRKVLGASVPDVVVLLVKDYAVLVMVALVVASPIAFVAMRRWLDSFEYRIELGAGTFAAVAIMTLLLLVATVSIQTVRAALADPVKTLRYE